MGKAADNERIKLRATFFNNLSIGLFLAGFIVPYLTAMGKADEIEQFFRDWLQTGPQLSDPQVRTILIAVLPIPAALWLAWRWRKRAVTEIAKIQD